MAITTYTGTGGVVALMAKFMELFPYHSYNGSDTIYLTEEVYFNYSSDGWADVYAGGVKFPFVPTNNGNDARTWEITQTACGYALAINGDIRAFVGKTIGSGGVESWGVIAYGSIDTNLHAIAADGMAEPWTWIHSHKFTQSDHYTQMYNATPATAPVYFPDLYVIACSPIAATRQMSLGGNTYFATMYIALADERTSGGGSDLSNYYTRPQTDAKIAAVQSGVETNAASITVLQAQSILCAAPMQDASVEGRYLLFAEYTFPQAANFESSDVTFSVRNRGVSTTPEDGILRVRLRYGKAAAAFQYAQIYWTQNSGIDPAKFILCCNNAAGTAQLYLDASTAYAGYICKALDMGTSANVVDFSAWNLYSPTTGTAELPLESDGWTIVTSAAEAAVSE